MSTSGRSFSGLPPGYPSVAALIGRDKTLAVFRKFRSLNCRHLLYLQSELMSLERQLDAIDAALANENPEVLRSWSEFAADTTRKRLFEEIRTKLCSYNEDLLRYDKIASLESPPNDTVRVLMDWLEHSQSIADDGSSYLIDEELRGEWRRERFQFQRELRELVTLDHDDNSYLGKIMRKSFISYLFIEDVIMYGSEEHQRGIWFYPKSMMQTAVTSVSLLLVTLQTVLSLVVLHLETRQAARLGLIGLLTVSVALLLAFCGAKKSDIIIGTIGFTAVLVVFVSGE